MARDMPTAAIAWLHALAERTGAFTISDVQRLRVGRRKTDQSPWALAVQVSPAGSSRTVRLLVEVQERSTGRLRRN